MFAVLGLGNAAVLCGSAQALERARCPESELELSEFRRGCVFELCCVVRRFKRTHAAATAKRCLQQACRSFRPSTTPFCLAANISYASANQSWPAPAPMFVALETRSTAEPSATVAEVGDSWPMKNSKTALFWGSTEAVFACLYFSVLPAAASLHNVDAIDAPAPAIRALQRWLHPSPTSSASARTSGN